MATSEVMFYRHRDAPGIFVVVPPSPLCHPKMGWMIEALDLESLDGRSTLVAGGWGEMDRAVLQKEFMKVEQAEMSSYPLILAFYKKVRARQVKIQGERERIRHLQDLKEGPPLKLKCQRQKARKSRWHKS